MVDQIGATPATGNLAALKRALKQDQTAKDLVLEAQNNLREFNESAGVEREIDPNAPVRRGQLIDVIA